MFTWRRTWEFDFIPTGLSWRRDRHTAFMLFYKTSEWMFRFRIRSKYAGGNKFYWGVIDTEGNESNCNGFYYREVDSR